MPLSKTRLALATTLVMGALMGSTGGCAQILGLTDPKTRDDGGAADGAGPEQPDTSTGGDSAGQPDASTGVDGAGRPDTGGGGGDGAPPADAGLDGDSAAKDGAVADANEGGAIMDSGDAGDAGLPYCTIGTSTIGNCLIK